MVVGKAKQRTMHKFARQNGSQGGCYYAHPAVKQFFANKVHRYDRQSAQNSRHVSAHHFYGMQIWQPPANKPNDASDKPGEEWSNKPYTTTGVEYEGVKWIEVGKVINQDFYVAYVIISISLSEPDPVIDENLVIRQGYAYVQWDATEGCQNYAHYNYWG